MGKAIASLAAGTGTVVVSVGGFYVFKGDGASAGDAPEASPVPAATSGPTGATSPQNPDQSQTNTTSKDFIFEDVDSFKSNMNKSGCIKDYFGGNLQENQSISDIGTGSPDDSSFFKSEESQGTDTYKSCLTIERKVTKYGSDGKWTGKFTWLWSFMRGDEGFITFNVAETSDAENGKMKFSGIFYLVGKKDNNWEIKHKHEPKSDIPDSSGDIDTYFPKASSELTSSVGGDYWGFVDNKEKFKKSCKTSECGEAVASGSEFVSKKLTWTSGTDQTKKLGGWSSSSTWWSSIYDSSNWNLENKITSFNGEWSLKSQSTQ